MRVQQIEHECCDPLTYCTNALKPSGNDRKADEAHIVLAVFGVGLDAVLRDTAAGNKEQLASALAWWAIGDAGFRG